MNLVIETPETSSLRYNKMMTTVKPHGCEYCGAPITSAPHRTRGPSRFCGRKCSSKATAASNLVKRRQTMFERYGATSTLGSPELRVKVEKTVRQKFGVQNVGDSKEVRARITATNIQKHGGKSPYSNPKVSSKGWQAKKLNAVKAHVDAVEALGFTLEPVPTSIHDTVSATHLVCGHSEPWTLAIIQRYPICQFCTPMTGTSQAELQLLSFIEGLGFEVQHRVKIAGVEVDLYLPKLKLAIEHHGLYWHSSALGNTPMKHALKLKHMEKNGVRLLQIFEDELLLKPQIVQSIIQSKLGTSTRIFARQTERRSVSLETATTFFNETHLAGSARISEAIGLFKNNELVACVGFGPSRFKTPGKEIVRLSFKLNTTVVGGVSKLLIEKNEPLFSYCDLRFGTGQGYESAGFVPAGDTKPGFWFFKSARAGRIHRSMLQKKKLLEMTGLDSSLTGAQLAAAAGYNTIFDAGHRRFIRD